MANFAAFASGKWECLKAEKCETEAERVLTLIRGSTLATLATRVCL